MKYLELIKESNEELQERYELVAERVAELAENREDILEAEIDMESLTKFRNYFTVHRDWDSFVFEK